MSIIDKVKNSQARRVTYQLTVKSAKNLTANMRRVTLHGEDLASFPTNSEGAYIKLVFGEDVNGKPVMRTYTVSEQRSALNEIDVDFMLHTSHDNSEHGIAAPWSMNAKAGDTIALIGPGPAKFINTEADYFLLAADMTALPALTANLKLLPKDSRGKAYIEILTEADRQDLQKPEGVELVWVINNEPGADNSPLFHAIEKAAWNNGQVAVWAACEFSTMKKIRQYLKVVRGVKRSHLYISSYWKKGNTEDQHKVLKQADAETE